VLKRRGRPPHPDILTPREWEVLGLLREALTNTQIGERLGITRDAAKYHVSQILLKLGVSTREEAAAWQPDRILAAPIALAPSRFRSLPAIGQVMLIGGAGVAVAGVVALAAVIGYGALTDDDGAPSAAADISGRVAFVREGDLWVRDMESGDETKLVDADDLEPKEVPSPKPIPGSSFVPRIERPEWSPDGEWISFAVGESVTLQDYPFRGYELYIARADGTGLRRVFITDAATQPGTVVTAAHWEWSPTRAELAYVEFVAPAGVFTLRVLAPAGQETGWPDSIWYNALAGMAWEPSGDTIASVQSGADMYGRSIGEAWELKSVDRRGTTTLLATWDPQTLPPQPDAWSPHGGGLLVWGPRATDVGRATLVVASANGSSPPIELVEAFPGADAAWAPDSTAIAVIADGGNPAMRGWEGRHLVVMSPDGRSLWDAPAGEFVEASPAWSPDSAQLAFVRAPQLPENGGLPDAHIWVSPGDGDAIQLTDDPAYTERQPQWSADSTQIVFVRLPSDAQTRETVSPELWAMEPDGSNQRKLMDLGATFDGPNSLLTDDLSAVFDWYEDGAPAVGSPTPTQGITVTPTISPAQELTVGDPVELPFGVAIIGATASCWQCDGGPTSVVRAYRQTDGTVVSEVLFDPEARGITRVDRGGAEVPPRITGIVAAQDGSAIVVGVCVRYECLTLGAPDADSVSQFYRSVDGGVSWAELVEVTGPTFLLATYGGGFIASSVDGEGAFRYGIFPEGSELTGPEDAVPLVGDNDVLLWATTDGHVITPDGALVAQLPDSSPQVDQVLGGDLQIGKLVVPYWAQAGRSVGQDIAVFALVEVGAPWQLEAHLHHDSLFRVGAWDSKSGRLWGTSTLIGDWNEPGVSPRPILVMVEDGVMYPVPEPFRSDLFSPQHFFYSVLALQNGPFAKVVNTGSCLNMRIAPNESAEVLECVADGVLLTEFSGPGIDVAPYDHSAWQFVVTPLGKGGWASTDYLELLPSVAVS